MTNSACAAQLAFGYHFWMAVLGVMLFVLLVLLNRKLNRLLDEKLPHLRKLKKIPADDSWPVFHEGRS